MGSDVAESVANHLNDYVEVHTVSLSGSTVTVDGSVGSKLLHICADVCDDHGAVMVVHESTISESGWRVVFDVRR